MIKDNKPFTSCALYALLLMIILTVFSGCFYGAIEKLPKEELFTLSLGKMEDQLDLFNASKVNLNNSFCMRDGLFYVANGNSYKIMQFTSFGDLLLLLYNPDPGINPPTIMLKTEDMEDKIANRIAAGYPFIDIGQIAADSNATVYVEDRVPRDEVIEDKAQGVFLASRVYRFSRQGALLDKLGQEGIGGTPYPYISQIFITKKNEPVIICMVPNAYVIYWYSEKGEPLYNLRFATENLPKEARFFPAVEKIQPDQNDHLLYFQISFFAEEIDESTNTKSTIKDSMTRIYTYDIETGKYESYFKVPESEKIKIQNAGNEIEKPGPSYELLGVNENGYYFLVHPEGINDMRLLILDKKGNTYKTRILKVDDSDTSELYYKYIHMSDSGIISGFLCFKEWVKVVWWRTDKLVGAANDAQTEQ